MASYTAVYPTAHSTTYVKATSKQAGGEFEPHMATNPALSLIGVPNTKSWRTSSRTNQRFHIDLGSSKIVRRIYYQNYHESGTDSARGAENFTFQGSNTRAGSFDDLVYANNGGWTNLTIAQSKLDRHSAANASDPKYILVTNAVAYRYYAFKIADNWGDVNWLGLRHIALMTEDGYPPPSGNFFIFFSQAYKKNKEHFKK